MKPEMWKLNVSHQGRLFFPCAKLPPLIQNQNILTVFKKVIVVTGQRKSSPFTALNICSHVSDFRLDQSCRQLIIISLPSLNLSHSSSPCRLLLYPPLSPSSVLQSSRQIINSNLYRDEAGSETSFRTFTFQAWH